MGIVAQPGLLKSKVALAAVAIGIAGCVSEDVPGGAEGGLNGGEYGG